LLRKIQTLFRLGSAKMSIQAVCGTHQTLYLTVPLL